MMFLLGRVKKESAEAFIFLSAVYSSSGWKLSIKSFSPHFRNRHLLGCECEQICVVVKRGSSAANLLLQSVSQSRGKPCQRTSSPLTPPPALPIPASDEGGPGMMKPSPCWAGDGPDHADGCAASSSHPHAGCWCCCLMFLWVFSLVQRPENGAACSFLKEYQFSQRWMIQQVKAPRY